MHVLAQATATPTEPHLSSQLHSPAKWAVASPKHFPELLYYPPPFSLPQVYTQLFMRKSVLSTVQSPPSGLFFLGGGGFS